MRKHLNALGKYGKSKGPFRRNWPEYNKFSVEEKSHARQILKELCETIKPPRQAMGRPKFDLLDIIFCATMKVFSTKSGRRSMSDLIECGEKKFLAKVPHYNTVLRYINDHRMTPILKELIHVSSLPLVPIESVFAVDSTGFTSAKYNRWYDKLYARNANQVIWCKAHLMIGVKSHIVTAVEITDSSVNDHKPFGKLVEETSKNFHVAEISGDKAYSNNPNLEIADRIGAVLYTLPRKNTTGNSGPLLKNMFLYFLVHREEFLEHYHQRSNIESTIWMIKSKFLETIKGKQKTSRINELLCKVLCHNLTVLVHALHCQKFIEAPFWKTAA